MANKNQTKCVIVTGASRGIGRAITEQLLTEGWQVWALARGKDGLEELKKSVNNNLLNIAEVDISKDQNIKQFFSKLLSLNLSVNALINNAAIQGGAAISSQSQEQWQKFFDINVTGAWSMIKNALPFFKKGSSIVNIGSVASVTGFANRSAYCASKHALNGLTKALALELAPQEIRVNLLCLGSFDTPMLRELANESGRDLQYYADRQLTGQLGLPSEAASTCSFLVSNQSSFMTGSVVTLDGGLLIKNAIG